MPKAKHKEMHIPNTADVKNLLKRANVLEDDMDKVREEKKDLAKEIKAAGINKKAFSMALKIMRNPPPQEFKETVNHFLEESGQMAFYV